MKQIKALFAFVLALAVAAPAFAVTPWDSITTAADVSGVQTTVLGILVSMMTLAVIFRAYRFIKSAINK